MAEPYVNPDIQDAEDFLKRKRITELERKLTALESKKQAAEADRPWLVPRLKELGARAGEAFLTPFSWLEKGAMRLAGQGTEGGPITKGKDIVSALAEDFGKEARGPKQPYVEGSSIFTDPTTEALKTGGEVLGMAPFGGPMIRGGLKGLSLAKEGFLKAGVPSGLFAGAEEAAELPEDPNFSDIMHSAGKVGLNTGLGTLFGAGIGKLMKAPPNPPTLTPGLGATKKQWPLPPQTPPRTNEVAPGQAIPQGQGGTIPQSVVEPPTALQGTVQEPLPALPTEPVGELPPLEPNTATIGSPDALQQTAGWNFQVTPRIQPDPIKGEQPANIREILRTVREKLNIAHTAPGGLQPGVFGQYEPWNASTKNRYYSDLDTALHEASHAIDDRYSIMRDFRFEDLGNAPYDQELQQFWPHGSASPQAPAWYNRAEGVAEYSRAWMINPVATEKAAPGFTAYFQSKVSPADLDAMRELGRQVRVFRGAQLENPAGAIAATQAEIESANPIVRWFRKGRGELFGMKWTDDLQTAFVDSLHPFKKAVETARQLTGKKLLPANDPMVLTRLWAGRHGKLNYIFDRGQLDSKGQVVKGTEGGLKSLFAPLDQTSVETLEADMRDVTTLMRSERVMDEWNKLPLLERRKGRLAPFGAGMADERNVAAQALAQLRQDPLRFERLTEAAKRYRSWADANLRILVEKGRMSEDAYNTIKANNEYYVAMNRLMEIAPDEVIVGKSYKPTQGQVGAAVEPIHQFEGSAKPLKDAYHSLLEQTYKAHSEADRNEIMQSFVDLMKTGRGMYMGEPKALGAIAQRVPEGTANTVTVFRNGEPEHWMIDDDVLKSIKYMTENFQGLQIPVIGDPLKWSAKLLRETVTQTPTFAVRNRIRDAWTRVVTSRNGSALFDSFKPMKDADIDNLRKFGGDMAGYYLQNDVNYTKMMNHTMAELVNDKQKRFIVADPKKLAKGYGEWILNSERAGRVAEYKAAFDKAKKLGYDDYNANLYAASQARDLMDFAVAGTAIRQINQYIPFTAARVRGAMKLIERAQEDPGRVAALWSAYVAAPTMAIYAINAQQGTLEEYRQLPTHIRDLYWVIPAGPNQWVTIPKPFELGVMGTSVERMMDAAVGGEHPFGNKGLFGMPEHVWSLINALSPIDSTAIWGPPVLSGVAQAWANYDAFKQQNIVPPHEEGKDLDLRKHAKEASSRLGGFIQDVIGIDARKADFLLEHQLGYVGRYAKEASDIGRENRRSLGIQDTGLVRQTPVAGTVDVEWVQDYANRRGLTGKKWFKQFKSMKSDVYKAGNSKAKEAAMKALRERASQLRRELERQGKS